MPRALQPHQATSGQRQLAPLLHRCPGVHCPHCWAFGPRRKSNSYFCGQIFALLKRFECKGMKHALFLLLWTQTEAKASFRESHKTPGNQRSTLPSKGHKTRAAPAPPTRRWELELQLGRSCRKTCDLQCRSWPCCRPWGQHGDCPAVHSRRSRCPLWPLHHCFFWKHPLVKESWGQESPAWCLGAPGARHPLPSSLSEGRAPPLHGPPPLPSPPFPSPSLPSSLLLYLLVDPWIMVFTRNDPGEVL